MAKVKSLSDLRKLQQTLKSQIELRERSDNPEQLIQVKVGMSTCGIASGAKEVMDFFAEELDRLSIDAIVSQTGCMGYCYAEPTIEITKPGQQSIVFGYVSILRAKEIIEQYIQNDELVDGIIPVNYKTIND